MGDAPLSCVQRLNNFLFGDHGMLTAAWVLAAQNAVTLSVGMKWPRGVYNFTSLRHVTLLEATLPVGVVKMLDDCPLVEHVEFRDCRVRIAVDCASVTLPAQRPTQHAGSCLGSSPCGVKDLEHPRAWSRT